MPIAIELVLCVFLLSLPSLGACPPNVTNAKLDTLPGSSITFLTTDDNATRVFGAAADSSLLSWNTTNGESSTVIRCAGSVEALALSRDNRLLVVGDGGGDIRFITLGQPGYPAVTRHIGLGIIQLLMAPSDAELLVVQRHKLALWNTREKVELWSRAASQEFIRASFRPDGGQIAITTGSSILLFDAHTGQQVREIGFREVKPFVSDIAFSNDGQFLVATLNTQLVILESATGMKLKSLPDTGADLTTVTLLRDDRRAVTFGEDNTLRQWDLVGGTLLDRWSQPPGLVTSSGRYLINVPIPGQVSIWDIRSRKRVQVLRYHSPLDNSGQDKGTGR